MQQNVFYAARKCKNLTNAFWDFRLPVSRYWAYGGHHIMSSGQFLTGWTWHVQNGAGDSARHIDHSKQQCRTRHRCSVYTTVSSRVALLIHKHNTNKGPAVARVSRPYSWCTLATCVHNCPSMMFRTCCCLRPKCKRSYFLIYITSGSYVNKLCKQVQRPIPPRNTCVANCGQTAAVSDMVTIDSL